MIPLAFRHGLRAAELVDLRWEQIEFRTATLHVRRLKQGTPSTHPILGDELRALRRLQRKQEPRSPFVFTSARGAPFTTAGFARLSNELVSWPSCRSSDADYKQVAALAALAAPYRHARLSGMKLGGDPNNPARFKDNATADELREEIMRRRAALNESGILDLERLMTPEAGIAYQPMSGVRTDRDCIHR
jgi:Phage integrase family